jgi:hypothetical protein
MAASASKLAEQNVRVIVMGFPSEQGQSPHNLNALLGERCPLPLVGRGDFPLPVGSSHGREYFSPTTGRNCKGNLLSVEGSMIDAVLNVAVFATLVLCVAGFGAWARRSEFREP